jgi:hypothetical protein
VSESGETGPTVPGLFSVCPPLGETIRAVIDSPKVRVSVLGSIFLDLLNRDKSVLLYGVTYLEFSSTLDLHMVSIKLRNLTS